jgi:hypothetical protein
LQGRYRLWQGQQQQVYGCLLWEDWSNAAIFAEKQRRRRQQIHKMSQQQQSGMK